MFLDQMGDVLDEGDVSKDTSLALISAVYFKKKWVKAFKRLYTNEVTLSRQFSFVC